LGLKNFWKCKQNFGGAGRKTHLLKVLIILLNQMSDERRSIILQYITSNKLFDGEDLCAKLFFYQQIAIII